MSWKYPNEGLTKRRHSGDVQSFGLARQSFVEPTKDKEDFKKKSGSKKKTLCTTLPPQNIFSYLDLTSKVCHVGVTGEV